MSDETLAPLFVTRRESVSLWARALALHASLNRSASGVQLTRLDGLVIALLATAGMLYAWWANHMFADAAIWSDGLSTNVYFESDIRHYQHQLPARVIGSRSLAAVHPLLPPLFYGAGQVAVAVGASLQTGVRGLLAVGAALSAMLLYVAQRGLGCASAAAALATIASLSSAAFTHWAGTPESYPIAFAALLVPFAVLAATASRSPLLWTVAIAVPGSATITNWVAGGLAALARHPLLATIGYGLIAVLAVGVLNYIYLLVFPFERALPMFDLRGIYWHLVYLAVPVPGLATATMATHVRTNYPYVLSDRLAALFVFAAVAPSPSTLATADFFTNGIKTIVTYDSSPLASLGIQGGLAILCWSVLVGLGLVSAARSRRRDVLFVTLGFLLFHVSLHLVFGEVVFLYVLHGLPSFAMLIGFALAGPLRIPAALFAAGFILLGAPHNTARFVESAELAAELVRRRMAG